MRVSPHVIPLYVCFPRRRRRRRFCHILNTPNAKSLAPLFIFCINYLRVYEFKFFVSIILTRIFNRSKTKVTFCDKINSLAKLTRVEKKN